MRKQKESPAMQLLPVRLLSVPLLPVAAVTLGCILAAPSALAVNVHFLRDSVLSKFSPNEAQDFRHSIGQALDTIEDKEVYLWRSESSELKGKLKPTFTYVTDGITCRRSLFLIGTDEDKENFRFDICKGSEGWKIKDTPARRFKADDWKKLEVSATQALEHPHKGQPVSWFNPDTQHSGVNVVTAIYRLNGNDCRDMAISIFDSAGNSSNGNYSFCKANSSGWERYIRPH